MKNEQLNAVNRDIDSGLELRSAEKKHGLEYIQTGRTDSDGWDIVEVGGTLYRRIVGDGAVEGYDDLIA